MLKANPDLSTGGAAPSVPSRRNFLGGAAALGAALLPAATLAAVGEGGDGRLLALRRELVGANAVLQNIDAEKFTDGISPASIDQENRLAAALDVVDELLEAITATAAHTSAGRQAKAYAVKVAFERFVCISRGTTIADIDDEGDLHERLAWSLAADVTAEARS